MDAVAYSHADKQKKRIEKFIENPDSDSGIVTVPKTIAAGETVTVPAGRVAILPNVDIEGTLVADGEVFIPSGGNLTEEQKTFITATAGQSVLNVVYPVGFVDVYVNGLKLGDDNYTATTGTSIELTSALNAGDYVEVQSFGTFELANAYTKGDTNVLLDTKADKTTTVSKVASTVILDNEVDLTATQTLTDAKLAFTNGRASNGGYNVETATYTGSVDFSTCPDGIHYVALEQGTNTPKFYTNLPVFDAVTGVMNDNDGITPLTTPISFLDTKPYQITSGVPVTREVSYPSIPKNIMEELYSSELSTDKLMMNGMEAFACRAWVNFNGTGTVAIRASGNVSSITDNGVGLYTVNFTTAMPDAEYSVSGIVGNGSGGGSTVYSVKTRDDIRSASSVPIATSYINPTTLDYLDLN